MSLKNELGNKWWGALTSAALTALMSLPILASASSAALFTIDGSDPGRFFSFTGSVAGVNGGVVDGEFHQVDLNTVDDADIVLGGALDFDLLDVLVVEVTLYNPSAPIDALSFSAGGNPGIFMISNAGTLAGPGQVPQSATVDFVNFAAKFDFDEGNLSANNLEQGETTVRLFSAYPLGSLFDGDNASFMVSSGAGDTSFNVSIVVPEPSTAVLALIGLAGLGLGARRRRV